VLASLASHRLGLNWRLESIELFTLCWWVTPVVWNVSSQRLVNALELPVILCLCALSTVHTSLAQNVALRHMSSMHIFFLSS
jgi:hypothetical protein